MVHVVEFWRRPFFWSMIFRLFLLLQNLKLELNIRSSCFMYSWRNWFYIVCHLHFVGSCWFIIWYGVRMLVVAVWKHLYKWCKWLHLRCCHGKYEYHHCANCLKLETWDCLCGLNFYSRVILWGAYVFIAAIVRFLLVSWFCWLNWESRNLDSFVLWNLEPAGMALLKFGFGLWFGLSIVNFQFRSSVCFAMSTAI